MRNVIITLTVLGLLDGSTYLMANEPAKTQETKTAQLYYYQPVQNTGYYQQGYGYVNQMRPVSSQVCIPGVGCGTFYPTSNVQTNGYAPNPYGQAACPNGLCPCPNGQCGVNQGYYFNGNTGIVPPRLNPAPVNYGYPAVNPFNQQMYTPVNNYGVQYTPAAPVRNTPVYPYNYVVQGNNNTNTAATSNPQSNSDSPFFK